MRPPKQASAIGVHGMVVEVAHRMASNHHNVPTRFDFAHAQSHTFAQLALDTIAYNRVADPLVDREAKPAIRQRIGECTQHKRLARVGLSRLANLLKAGGRLYAISLFHPVHTAQAERSARIKPANSNIVTSCQRCIMRCGALCHFTRCELYAQLGAPILATTSEHIAPTRAAHANPKPMCLEAFTNFRLPSALCGHTFAPCPSMQLPVQLRMQLLATEARHDSSTKSQYSRSASLLSNEIGDEAHDVRSVFVCPPSIRRPESNWRADRHHGSMLD